MISWPGWPPESDVLAIERDTVLVGERHDAIGQLGIGRLCCEKSASSWSASLNL